MELIEVDRPKFSLSKCVVCSDPARRRVEVQQDEQTFGTYWLCDNDDCFDDLEKVAKVTNDLPLLPNAP